MSNANPYALTTSLSNAELIQTLSGQSVPSFPQLISALVAGFGPTFVFRPGGVAGGNVYTDWPTMMAAVGKLAGPKWIEIDDTIAAANVPAGTWDVTDCTMSSNNDNGGLLTFLNGAHLNFAGGLFWLKGDLTLQAAGTTAVISTGAATWLMVLELLASVFGGAAAPFVDVQNGGTFALYMLSSGTLGEGTNTALTVDAGGTGIVNAYQSSSIQVNALAGAVPVDLEQDSSVAYTNHQHTPATVQLIDLAGQVAYTPATPGNWNPVPTQVAAALDALAAPNSFVEGGGPLGPATSVTFTTTGTLSRKHSGVFVISATISGTDSTTETVVVELDIDGGGIGVPMGVPTGGTGGSWAASTTWMHTVTDTTPHTFGITATGAGNLSVGLARVGVAVFELP